MKILRYFTIMTAACIFAACSHSDYYEENLPGANKTLSIITRAPSGSSISYPVTVYAFQNGICKEVSTLEAAGTLQFNSLEKGECTLYAVAGAGDDYTLPAKESATPTSVIELNDGKIHADLMTANTSVTISESAANTAELTLERKVLQLTNITIQNFPSGSVSDVTVEISPLAKTILLNGNTSSDYVTYKTSLTKQTDGTTWKSTVNQYFIPVDGQEVSIKVAYKLGEVDKSFTYHGPAFAANKLYDITGNYTKQLSLTTTVIGVEWGEDAHINFSFDGETSGDDPTPPSPSGIPSVGDLYKTCYVLSVDDNQVTLLSPVEGTPDTKSGQISQVIGKIESFISSNINIEGVTGWRIPHKEEANIIFDNLDNINAKFVEECQLKKAKYYSYGATEFEIHSFDLNSSTFNTSDCSTGSTSIIIRPVAIVTIE